MKDTIDQTIQRTQRYWYIDGLSEISFGGVCLGLGVYFFAQATLPQDSLLFQLLTVSFVIILVGGSLAARRAVNALKARLTFPRTGYVAYPDKSKTQSLLRAGLAFLLAILFSLTLTRLPENVAWMPILSGLIMGGAWLYLAVRIGLVRFYLISAGSFISGLALGVSGIGNMPGLAGFYGLMALMMIVSGGITLAAYLRNTRPAQM